MTCTWSYLTDVMKPINSTEHSYHMLIVPLGDGQLCTETHSHHLGYWTLCIKEVTIITNTRMPAKLALCRGVFEYRSKRGHKWLHTSITLAIYERETHLQQFQLTGNIRLGGCNRSVEVKLWPHVQKQETSTALNLNSYLYSSRNWAVHHPSFVILSSYFFQKLKNLG